MTTKPEPFRPELLAGYADGELSTAERLTVEAWLREHPEDQAELEAQKLFTRKNNRLMQKASVTQPAEEKWNQVYSNIRNAIQPTRPAYREPTPPAWRRWAIGVAALAMAGLIALNVDFGFHANQDRPTAVSNESAFAVASDNDVDIISVQGDESIIVIGLTPLGSPLEMIPIGDVVLEAIFSDADGHLKKVDINSADPKKPILIDPNKTQPVP